MQNGSDKNRYHSTLAIVIGFILSCTAFAISALLKSNDASGFFEEMSVALYIFACTVQGLKLTEENKTMPSAGFTMMAISQGVIFASYFEDESQGYHLFTGGMFLFLPAMFLISFYAAFPAWLRILGILCCIPFTIDFIIYERDKQYVPVLDTIYLIAEIMLYSTAVIWAIFIWKNYRLTRHIPLEE